LLRCEELFGVALEESLLAGEALTLGELVRRIRAAAPSSARHRGA
jgi:hypothetical protein